MPNAMDVFELIAPDKLPAEAIVGLLRRARPLVASYTRARTLRAFIEWASKAQPAGIAGAVETTLAFTRLPALRSALEATGNDTTEVGGAEREAALRDFAEALADAFLDVPRPAAQYARECASGSEQHQWEDARRLQLRELAGDAPA